MLEADQQLAQTERPRFYEQQYLGADDLAAIVEYGRIARARHELGAHVWGIGAGMQLVERPSAGGVDVYVQPGVAWDGVGRTVALLAPYKIPGDLFRSIAFDAATDNTTTPGRLVPIWLQYVEEPVGGPPNGFATCASDDQYSRTVETFRIVIGEQPAHSDRHDPITVAGNTTDAAQVLQSLGSAADPLVTDESVPYQTFPAEWGETKWLIPLGVIRWLPNTDATQAGSFVARTPDDLAYSERQRIYVGAVAETVNAPRGFIRMRRRDTPYAPAVWSDDLVWCEGTMRVSGDAKLLAGKIVLRDQNNDDRGVPLTIGRVEANSMTPAGRDIFLQIGAAADGSNRMVVGPVLDNGGTPEPHEVMVIRDNGLVGIGSSEPRYPLTVRGQRPGEESIGFEAGDGTLKWHINQKVNGQPGFNIAETGVADGRVYIQAGGNVGVNTTAPSNQLHVNGNTGIRQNRLYLSGGSGGDNWSSVSYNAHHNAGNGGWVFPDDTRGAVTIEMDDQGGVPHFDVLTTTAGATTTWTQRFRINGNSGDAAIAHNGGNFGVGTNAPTHKLHVASNKGLRANHLYMSGGDGGIERWSSISYNAFHNETNSGWTFPDSSRRAVTVEMDDSGGTPRFEVYSTTSGSPTFWVQRFAVNGENGNINMAQNGGTVGIGVATGLCRLHVADSKAMAAGDPAAHVALIDNTSTSDTADVLALRVGTPSGSTTYGNNFVTCFAGSTPIGSIEGNGASGLTFNTSSADYAEWLRRVDPAERLEPGDVVGVYGGKVSRTTLNADSVLVVSTAPVVLGNRPADDEADAYSKIAMLGQVPVKVRGPVEVGDFIVAGGNDGVGVAIASDAMTFEDYARVVGVAWESSASSGTRTVRVGIGLPASAVWRALQREVTALRSAVTEGQKTTKRSTKQTAKRTTTSKRATSAKDDASA